MTKRKRYDSATRRKLPAPVSLVFTVFLVGVFSGCAVSKSPNEPRPATTSQTESQANTNAASGSNSTMTESTGGMKAGNIEEKEPELTAAEILAQTNVTPRRGFEDSENAGDVRKSDLLGWQHRVYGIDLIDKGQWELARKHLQWAAEMMNNPAQANNILVQLDADPVAYLGADSVSYRVARNDTLGGLAQRFLNDSLKFPILARYNAIDVPMALEPGTVIQIPSAYDTGTATETVPAASETVQPQEQEQATTTNQPAQPAEVPDTTPAVATEPPAEDAQSETVAEPAATSNVAESIKALYSRVIYHYERGELEQADSLNNQILETDGAFVPAILMKQRIEQGLQ